VVVSMPGMRNEKNLRVQRSYHPNSATGNVRDPDVRDFLPWAKSGYAHAVLWSVRCSAVISPVCLLFSPPYGVMLLKLTVVHVTEYHRPPRDRATGSRRPLQ